MKTLSNNQMQLLEEARAQCARRGWFFINATTMDDLNDMLYLEKNRLIELEERDIRIDHVNQRVKAGEFVGTIAALH